MRKLRFLLFVFSIFVMGQLTAQLTEPVKWSFSQKKVSDNEVLLIFKAKIDVRWHLYTQFFEEGGPMRLSFTFEDSKNFKRIGKVAESPKPKKVRDEVFDMDVQYLEGAGTFTQKIKVLSEKDFVVKGEIEGQACNDIDGSCVPFYPEFEFKIKGVKQEVGTSKSTNEVQDTSKTIVVAESDSLQKDTAAISVAENSPDTIKTITPVTNVSSKIDLGDGSLWLLFWISFLAGLLAILTPCVFPMIPMTVSFFMKSGENKIKGRFQAIFYGVSIILIYTVIGTLIAVAFGVNFANWLSTHWLPNVLFFLIFMIFAASFLGMFEITMPSWIVNKSDSQVDKGGFWAPFFMAFTLVLVSFSCTGPLVGAILVKSAGGAVLEPIVGMLGFSLAFALPFTLFAFFPSWLSNLPKSGGWLNSVKVVLGFIEIGLGLKFLSIADQTYHWGILDREIYIGVWIVLAILLGMYFLGKLKFAHDSDIPYVSVPRLGLAIITLSFAVYLIPGMFGAPLKALSGYLPPMSSHDFDISQIVRDNQSGGTAEVEKLPEKPKYAELLHLPHGIKGYFDYEQALRVAKQLNRPVFIDFTGHGCVNCREMEANVWSDPRVLSMLKKDYLVVALYVDDKTELPENEWITSTYDGKVKKTIGRKYADFQISRFEVNAQPYYVLLDTNGELLVKPRAYDLNVEAFVEFLENGLKVFEERQ
jgi:thiol:disulfide interchange protein